jgi:polygalacturonase
MPAMSLLAMWSLFFMLGTVILPFVHATLQPVLDVRDYGVVGDGKSDDTDALQYLLDHYPDPHIVIPADAIVISRPLTITASNVTLQVDGQLVAFAIDPNATVPVDALWPKLPPLPTYGESRDGNLVLQNQALLYATGVSNLRITGGGVIDGRGQGWWDAHNRATSAVPSATTTTRALSAGRPNLILVYNSSNIEIDSISLHDAPFWTLHTVLCRYVHIHHMSIRAPMYAPNVDGIDPDSCQHVMIEHNDIGCGDDHIAIKSGVCGHAFPNDCNDPVWASGAYRTENVTVRHNTFRTGMGIAIGSDTSGGVVDVNIHDNLVGVCEFGSEDPQRSCGWGPALHVKTTVTRGNVIENIVFQNNVVYNASIFILLEIGYQTSTDELPPKDYPGTAVRGISFLGNRVVGRGLGARFSCSQYDACHNVTVFNNTIDVPSTDFDPWGCHYVADYNVRANVPAGLEDCMANSMKNTTILCQRPGAKCSDT